MKRVNTFEIVPQTENDKGCLLRLLDASASLWNELTYERRQNYFGDGDVWDTSNTVDSTTASSEARPSNRSRAKTRKRGGRSSPLKRKARTLTPSYWGNEEEGRELRTYIETTSTRFSGASGRVSKFLSGKS